MQDNYNEENTQFISILTVSHYFLTADKITSGPSVLAGKSDSKNPDPYYFPCGNICTTSL